MHKVLVGASSFGKASPEPIDFLQQNDVEVMLNPEGRKLTKDEVIRYAQDCDGILAGLEIIDKDVIDSLPNLKAITRIGIGIDNVDTEYLKTKGIKFNFTPDGPTKAVAELTVATLLTISRRVIELNDNLHKGNWQKIISSSLYKKTVLIIGAGRIGRLVGDLIKPFVKEVVYYDPFIPEFSSKPLEKLLPCADVVSIHASGHKQIIGSDEINSFKDGAILLNPSRGGVVNEDAVYNGIKSGKLSAAWFDVFDNEPYSGPLTELSQVILTPHASSYTKECRLDMEMEAAIKILEDLNG